MMINGLCDSEVKTTLRRWAALPLCVPASLREKTLAKAQGHKKVAMKFLYFEARIRPIRLVRRENQGLQASLVVKPIMY